MKHISIILVLLFLVSCGEEGKDEVTLKTDDEKKAYITEIGYSGREEEASKLKVFLNDPNPEVIGTACFFLGYLKSREHIPELYDLLTHKDPTVVNMAASGLAQMLNEEDINLLARLHETLNSNYLLARMSAIEAIGNIGNEQSRNVLERIFVKEEPAAKLQIISAVGKIGSKESLPLLRNYLNIVNAMDFSVPNKGGTRGSVPHPSSLKATLEKSIAMIEENV